MHKKPTIVIVSSFAPWPISTGSTQRIHSLGQWLKQYAKVIILLPRRIPVPNNRIPNYDRVIGGSSSILAQVAYKFSRKFYFYYSRLFNQLPKWDRKLDRFYDASEAAHYKKYLQQIKPDAVICEKHRQMPNLYAACESLNIPIILDTNDIVSIRQSKEVKLGLREEIEISLEEEIAIWRLASTLIAIQPEEYTEILKLSPTSQLICLPQAFPPVEPSSIARKNKFVLIVASTGRPNVQGIEAFLQEQWPIVLQKHPDAELHVCGNISKVISPCLLSAPKTTFYGYVEDISALYHQATVVLNPVLYGSGLKIKSVEALRYGKCLLSTPVGVEGMPEVYEVMPVVPPNQLGQTLITLLSNVEEINKYEEVSRQIFNKYYTPDTCYSKLLDILFR